MQRKTEKFTIFGGIRIISVKILQENMQFLTEILELVEGLNKQYGFESLTMGEATKTAFQLNEEKTYEKIRPQSHYEM